MKKHESNSSFKERIKELMKELEGRQNEEPTFRNSAPSFLVRNKNDRGYYPPPRKKKLTNG